VSPGALPAFRPAGVDGLTWSRIRREWNAAADHPGKSTQIRKAIAVSLGMTYERLGRWAKRCGWLRQQRNGMRR
jgi:hypothetical protein